MQLFTGTKVNSSPEQIAAGALFSIWGLGSTVIVKSIGSPEQPFTSGVTWIVTLPVTLQEFCKVMTGIEPVVCSPIGKPEIGSEVVASQTYVVFDTSDVNIISSVASSEQICWVSTVFVRIGDCFKVNSNTSKLWFPQFPETVTLIL